MANLTIVPAAIKVLSPSQQDAFNHLMESWAIGNLFVVWSAPGMGRTTILNELHRQEGGELLRMKDYIEELRNLDPFKMEDALEQIILRSFQRNDLVILDDLDLVYSVMCACGFGDAYPRPKYIEAILTNVVEFVSANPQKRLVFGNQGSASHVIGKSCYYSGLQKFDASDYQFICKAYLEDKVNALDFNKIFRFAPKLHAHQLKSACLWLKESGSPETEKFIEYLRKRKMASNVDLEEVEAVDLNSLRGLDGLIESLEANIVVPLEREDIADEFDIQPKRGVLLAGPPGTGKTTVGRALAHRLKSKFFLIDGTFISGTRDFYDKIHRVFDHAKNNAPSIIFIDDSDVIFENKDDFGLYRYLLTALDGLESESNKRVCIMMTTMDVSSIPPALVRSGRIELWLETTLPNEVARQEILSDHLTKLPAPLKSVDVKALAAETEGLTGADLRRLVEDGKILYAYDKSKKCETDDILGYFKRQLKPFAATRRNILRLRKRASSRMQFPTRTLFCAEVEISLLRKIRPHNS